MASTESISMVERALPMRRRRDLVVEPMRIRGRRQWHLKDPCSLRYWQLGEEELFLWQQLDGEIGLAQWQERFQRRFAPRQIERSQLHAYLGMLHREGLVVSDNPGQATTLLQRRDEQRRREWWSTLANPLAIRFRGLDPEPLLARLYPLVAWMFRPVVVWLAVLWMISALGLVTVHWNEFLTRLPAATAFLTPDNLLLLVSVLAAVKVCHELGHALACRHFGGECREMGVMLLVFTPCLYCNVSDMWLVRDKWRRIAVSGAGIFVELWLAASATWLWWFAAPGPFQSVCLAVMTVCSVSTLLFNANPLLRYDGYFMLSDWLELPNLRPDADAAWRSLAARWVGIDVESEPSLTDRRGRIWLLAFALASFIYRLFITVVILWYLHEWLMAMHLGYLSVVLVAGVLVCSLIPGVIRMAKWWTVPRRQRWLPGRLAVSVALAAVLGGVIVNLPVPRRVEAPATMRPADASAVYVTVPGRLVMARESGAFLQAGELVAELENEQLELEVTRLTGECAVWERQRDSLRRQQVHDQRLGVTGAAGQLQIAEQSLREARRQLDQRLAERKQLAIHAPHSGVVLAPPPLPPAPPGHELPRWSGSPLDERNRGSFLETGTQLAFIGQRQRQEAYLLVEQAEMAELAAGQSVSIQLDELPGRFLTGTVAAVGTNPCEEAPGELVAKQSVPMQMVAGQSRLVGTYFPVQVELSSDVRLPFGASGRARISVAPQTIARRIYNVFFRTFK